MAQRPSDNNNGDFIVKTLTLSYPCMPSLAPTNTVPDQSNRCVLPFRRATGID